MTDQKKKIIIKWEWLQAIHELNYCTVSLTERRCILSQVMEELPVHINFGITLHKERNRRSWSLSPLIFIKPKSYFIVSTTVFNTKVTDLLNIFKSLVSRRSSERRLLLDKQALLPLVASILPFSAARGEDQSSMIYGKGWALHMRI